MVKAIGSGLHGHRRRLRWLVADHTVGTIVVEHRECLSRFGFEYVEAALVGRGPRILVMEEGEIEADPVRDATEVTTSRCARLYGQRSARQRAERAGGGTGRLMPHPDTYQTRVAEYAGIERKAGDAALSAYGELYGRVERKLFAEVAAGQSAVSLKREYLKRYGIPARMFNAVRVSLEGENRHYRRMLSSFSYDKVKAYFLSRSYRQGVEVRQVNTAFSSVIGRVKFMERYGLSVHQAAALVLARRGLGCSERIPRRRVALVGEGVQVAFSVPVRKRVKHVWTYWGAVAARQGPRLQEWLTAVCHQRQPFLQR